MSEQRGAEEKEHNRSTGAGHAAPQGKQKESAGCEVGQDLTRLRSTASKPAPEREAERLEK